MTQPLPVQHDGQPLPPDDEYPQPPDASIGAIVSSASNRTRTGFKSLARNQLSAIVAGVVLSLVFCGLISALLAHELVVAIAMRGLPQMMLYETPVVIVLAVVGAVVPTLVIVVAFWFLRKAQTSWVGTDGIQRWEKGVFGPSNQILRFADAATLTTHRVRQFVNGGYTGTSYTYTWWGPSSNKLLALSGVFREPGVAMFGGNIPIPAHDQIVFLEAAERAWSRHKLGRILNEMQSTGVARFQNGGSTIRIGRGFIEIEGGGKVERLERSQIESATVEQGVVVIRRTGAKEGWFSSEGVFRLPVAGMADFMVFLMVFENQLQLRMV